MMSGNESPERVAAAAAIPALPKSRGTGFEPYFADAPMTPEEAQVEKEQLYSPDRPIHERMEECVHRFRRRRRFPSNLGQYFDHYLFLGGIDSNQRQSSSLASASAAELDLMSPEEICDLTTAKMVRGGTYGAASKFCSASDDKHWAVDFTGVVAGFLSDALPGMTGQDYIEMCRAVDVVENFLRYVLYHDACPEHADDVRAASALCERARIDLPAAHAAQIQFPGQFNLAAAELFLDDISGYYVREDADGRAFRRPEGFDAEAVFKVGVMLAGTLANLDALQRKIEEGGGGIGSVRVLREEDRDLEVVSIHPPSDNVRKQFKAIRLAAGKPAIAPFGTAVMEPCQIDDGWDAGDVVASQPIDDKTQSYLLDERILRFMQPGMKLRLRVCDLDIGLTFVKQAMSVLVPWYTFLPQALMQGFKEPRPNDKPAPSVQNPHVEEANSDGG